MDNFELLKKFDCLVENKMKKDLKLEIESIKNSYGFTDDDISFFVGRNFSDGFEYSINDISAFELARLYELCFPMSETKAIIDEYLKNRKETLNEKVSHLLNLFNVRDEKTLDELISTIIDVRSSIYEVDKEALQVKKEIDETDKEIKDIASEPNKNVKCDKKSFNSCRNEHKNHEHRKDSDCVCCSSNESKKGDKNSCENNQEKKGCAKMSYSYFNSDTMDEPKTKSYTFEFDPNEVNLGDYFYKYSDKIAKIAEKIQNKAKKLF